MTHQSLNLDADDTELMEIWHEQTKYHRVSLGRRKRIMNQFFSDPQKVRMSAQGWDVIPGEKVIPLSVSPSSHSLPFALVMETRASTPRKALRSGFGIEVLSELLRLSVKANRESSPEVAADCTFYFKPYPSAGGLYPCELFVVPGLMKGLERKPYRYDSRLHALIDFGGEGGRFPAVEFDAALDEPGVALIIAAVLDRATQKYGPRGYRMSCLEAGHIGQNLSLASTSLGLKHLVYSAFYDNELERWLRLDGVNEVVLSAVLVGPNDSR